MKSSEQLNVTTAILTELNEFGPYAHRMPLGYGPNTVVSVTVPAPKFSSLPELISSLKTAFAEACPDKHRVFIDRTLPSDLPQGWPVIGINFASDWDKRYVRLPVDKPAIRATATLTSELRTILQRMQGALGNQPS